MRRLLVSVVAQTSNLSLQPFHLFTKRANDALEFLVLRIVVRHYPTFAHGVCRPRYDPKCECRALASSSMKAPSPSVVVFDEVPAESERHVNFCLRCGTRVEGVFCWNCGASTSLDDYVAVESALEAPPLVPIVQDVEEPAAAPSYELHSNVHRDVGDVSLTVNEFGKVVGGLPLGRARRSLVLETRWVMVAFLLPAVMSAVLVFAAHVSGVADVSRFPSIVHGHPITNMILGILGYLPVAATVPLALYLLARTGQNREVLGLGVPSFKRDVIPGLGLGAAAFVSEVVLLTPLTLFLVNHRSLFVSVSTQYVPKYYVVWGLAISAVTAIAEEVLVNGYLITRLGQLGWTPRKSLILSLILRTSYHV